ncbi:G-type lectin S-receptor-like serine threonine-kinase RLK1 [Olea europaea subsp. europaea]|uniref:Receptor-like serine/threonine-protein kinase n=1 Tax=Olea europaea subsp. europaea TaxID=158383 RepID=A0A8S0U1J0_OLEEU|nr:G-type lectin S-receptor-like serine threonine-kinase RLK1 [Olea europaea subsp. europaea]
MAFPVSSKIIFFLLLFLFLLSATAQRSINVTLGSSITANKANSSWVSPSGEFAFGFQQIIPGGYLLAIWFNKIPERTVVWSANRDRLVQEGSKVQLYADGRLELRDPRDQQIWAATSSRGVAYGSMLNTGNFVLANSSSVVLWQSFDEPTDTLLPTQKLNKGGILVSSFSKTNYSRGRFLFTLQNDGNLVSYTRNFPLDEPIFAYWSTKTTGRGFQVIFNQSGNIFLVAENRSVLNFVSPNEASTSQFYHRAILEYDGVLRHYVYPKSSDSEGGREMAWSSVDFIPSNICTSMGERSGFGACGFNSLCSLGSDQIPHCDCPYGYTLIDPNDRMSGCKPNFVAQNCDEGARETDLFSFIDMPNTNWPFSDYALFKEITEDWCRQDCLNDCFCAVAIYNNGRCWKKQYPLTNGAIDSSLGGKALIKIRNSNATVYSSVFKKSESSTLIIILSVFLGITMFLLLSLLLYVFCFSRQKSKSLQPYQDLPGLNIRRFSFKELEVATNGFKEELGRGACSTVYKGILKNDNIEIVIAVKKLYKLATEGEQEFKAEVNSISRTNHKNLVQLLGYCEEDQNRVLVYEFMSNGSLAKLLIENSRPNWYKRMQIAFATARGICYLHEECKNPIIHCDIKPQNVLLDEFFTAKISDFGLAKLLKPDQSKTTTGIRGTKGYIAPEWFRNMPITVKVDVYSFGILLLELICCRRNYEPDVEFETEMVLADFAYDCYKEGTVNLLVADDEEALGDKRFDKFVMIAIWCIQEEPTLRPTMKRVIQLMEGSVEVPIPPNPTSFGTSV